MKLFSFLFAVALSAMPLAANENEFERICLEHSRSIANAPNRNFGALPDRDSRTGLNNSPLNPFINHTVALGPKGKGRQKSPVYQNYRDPSQLAAELDAIETGKLTSPVYLHVDRDGALKLERIIFETKEGDEVRRHNATQAYRLVTEKSDQLFATREQAPSQIPENSMLLKFDKGEWKHVDGERTGLLYEFPKGTRGRFELRYAADQESFDRATIKVLFKEPRFLHRRTADNTVKPVEAVYDRKQETGHSRVQTKHLDSLFRVSSPDGTHKLYMDDQALLTDSPIGTFNQHRGLVYRFDGEQWVRSHHLQDIAANVKKRKAGPKDFVVGKPRKTSEGTLLVRESSFPQDASRWQINRKAVGASVTAAAVISLILLYMSELETPIAGGGQGGDTIVLTMDMGEADQDEDVGPTFQIPVEEDTSEVETKEISREELLSQLTEDSGGQPGPTHKNGTVQSGAQGSQAGGAPPSAHGKTIDELLKGGGHFKGQSFFGIGLNGDERIAFIVDTSGSMEGLSEELLRLELTRSLANLPNTCSFNIFPFNERCYPWQGRLLLADEPTKRVAVNYASNLRAVDSGTNFRDAFRTALGQRPNVIFFLTDGADGSGGPDLSRAKNVVIHTIAFGEGAEIRTLKDIAKKHRGSFLHFK